ncbi:MAG: GntR family transcriptional regulator [Pseudonocardiaceae bacterium]
MEAPLSLRDTNVVDSIATQSFRAQATRILRSQIVSGSLKPGTLYSIGDIAQRLRVSITPVREALHDLAKDGLIEMKRNRGFMVRTPTSKELDDIVQIRSMLEVSSVRELANGGYTQDFGALRELCEQTESYAEAENWEGFLDSDRDFHLSLLSALGNAKLLDIVGSLRDQTRLLGLDSAAGTSIFRQSTKEHALILDAIGAGDADRAATLMASHLGHIKGIWSGRSESR